MPALEGELQADAIEIGPDGEELGAAMLAGETAFGKLVEHMRPARPNGRHAICDVPAATIRRIANEFLAQACVGETVEIEGKTLPFRPVAITLGKTVNNGWGGYECCWARTVAVALVGGLEVPGRHARDDGAAQSPDVRPRRQRQAGDRRLHGLSLQPDRPGASGAGTPNIRNAYQTLVPLAANGPWSQALGPTHLAWMFLDGTPKGLPAVTFPELWFLYRTNPAISFWDTAAIAEKMSRFPFVVAFAYTRDESNHMADILLPECTDLEGLQLIRIGGTKYVEQFWEEEGFALRQPVVAASGEARDFTDIATELARRTGLLEPYNAAINRGAAGRAAQGATATISASTSRRPTAATRSGTPCAVRRAPS